MESALRITILYPVERDGTVPMKPWKHGGGIFTLHTAGIKYSAIILPVLRKEVIVAVCSVLVGGIVVYSIRHPEPLLLLLSSAVLFLMYVLLNFVGYIFFSKREFLQMSFRRE